jgi:hypothetical protein
MLSPCAAPSAGGGDIYNLKGLTTFLLFASFDTEIRNKSEWNVVKHVNITSRVATQLWFFFFFFFRTNKHLILGYHLDFLILYAC